MAELSSQGTEVNKNSTSYTSVVSPQKKKKKKKKEKKNKERVWGQTTHSAAVADLDPYFSHGLIQSNEIIFKWRSPSG